MALSKIQKEGKQFQCFVWPEEYIEIKNAMVKGRFKSQHDFAVYMARLVNCGAIDEQLKRYFGQGFNK